MAVKSQSKATNATKKGGGASSGSGASASKKQNKVLVVLEEQAKSLGIEVRYEKTSATGGLCRLKGQPIIIVDKNSNTDYKVYIIETAIANFLSERASSDGSLTEASNSDQSQEQSPTNDDFDTNAD